jgi:hypothetical protein
VYALLHRLQAVIQAFKRGPNHGRGDARARDDLGGVVKRQT